MSILDPKVVHNEPNLPYLKKQNYKSSKLIELPRKRNSISKSSLKPIPRFEHKQLIQSQ